MPRNSTPPREGMASRWEGCRLDALPRFPAGHFPLPSSASLPKIEVEATIRQVRGVEHFEDDVSLLEVRFT